MSKHEIDLGNGTKVEARVYEETVITYDASAIVNGRRFSVTDYEDEEEAIDDLREEILAAFPELASATPEEAEEIKAQTPLWMRKGESHERALERWQGGEPLPAPVSSVVRSAGA